MFRTCFTSNFRIQKKPKTSWDNFEVCVTKTQNAIIQLLTPQKILLYFRMFPESTSRHVYIVNVTRRHIRRILSIFKVYLVPPDD